MSLHCLAFLLFAADCILVGFTESSVFFNKKKLENVAILLIDELIAFVFLNLTSSLILVYIFIKIYLVVKNKTNDNEIVIHDQMSFISTSKESNINDSTESLGNESLVIERVTLIDEIRKTNGVESGILGALEL